MAHRVTITIHRGGKSFEVVDLEDIAKMKARDFLKKYGRTALVKVNRNLKFYGLSPIEEDPCPTE